MHKLQWSAVAHEEAPPPVAKRPAETTLHGVTLSDDYAWLKAANWQEILRDPAALPDDIRAVLEAENDYARGDARAVANRCARRSSRRCAGASRKTIPKFPAPDGPWLYYARHKAGGQHPVFCRVNGHGEARRNSPRWRRGWRAARAFSTSGLPATRRIMPSWPGAPTRRARNFMRSGSAILARLAAQRPADRAEIVRDTDGSLVWMADSSGFYYVRTDENHRPAEVFRHRTRQRSRDRCPRLRGARSRFVHSSPAQPIGALRDHQRRRSRFVRIPSDRSRRTATQHPRLVEPRAPGLRYDVEASW